MPGFGFLARVPRGRTVLFWFVGTQIVYVLMVAVTLPHLQALAGGLVPFDLSPGGYGHGEATTFLSALGAAGRTYYLWRQLPLDFLYPGLFALSYALIWIWFAAKLVTPARRRFVSLLPFAIGLLDYGENAAIIAMIQHFPDLPATLVTTASALTIAKSAATTLFFVALLGLMFRVGFIAYRNRT